MAKWSVFGHSEWNWTKLLPTVICHLVSTPQPAFVKRKATILVQTHGGGCETIRHDMLATKPAMEESWYRCPQLNEKLKLLASRRSWTANFHFILFYILLIPLIGAVFSLPRLRYVSVTVDWSARDIISGFFHTRQYLLIHVQETSMRCMTRTRALFPRLECCFAIARSIISIAIRGP